MFKKRHEVHKKPARERLRTLPSWPDGGNGGNPSPGKVPIGSSQPVETTQTVPAPPAEVNFTLPAIPLEVSFHFHRARWRAIGHQGDGEAGQLGHRDQGDGLAIGPASARHVSAGGNLDLSQILPIR